MALTIAPPLKLQVLITDPVSGLLVPNVDGFVYTKIAGTTTPLATYSDYQAQAQNTNPIQLDSRGECNCFLLPQAYDFTVTDANDVFVEDQFGIIGQTGLAITYVNTIDELRNLTPGVSNIVFMAGYNSANDTCGAEWHWNANSTATADDVFVVSPASEPGSGRYIREYQGQKVTPKFAGILGDGNVQDWTLFTSAISTSFPEGLDFYLPPGNYLVGPNQALAFPLSNIDADGASFFSINDDGGSLTLTQGFSHGRTLAFLGIPDLSSAKLDAIYPEWFGDITDTAVFSYMGLASYPGTCLLDTSATYHLGGSYTFTGNVLDANDANVVLDDDTTITGTHWDVKALRAVGATHELTLVGSVGVIENLFYSGTAALNSGALNLEFGTLTLINPQVVALSSSNGSSGIYINGGEVSFVNPSVTQGSGGGGVKYGYTFDTGAQVILFHPIDGGAFDTATYRTLNAAAYSTYGIDAYISGIINFPGDVSNINATTSVVAGTFVTAGTNVTAGGKVISKVGTSTQSMTSGGRIISNTTTYTSTGTGINALASGSILANSLHANGDALRMVAQGTRISGTSDVSFLLTLGGVTFSSKSFTNATFTQWRVEADIIRISTTGINANVVYWTNTNVLTSNPNTLKVTDMDLALNVSITFTADNTLLFSAGDNADNALTQHWLGVDYIPAPM